MDINSFYMEIGLLCENSSENCLWEDLSEAFNMLMSTVKGKKLVSSVSHPDYGTL